jgi:hypothetical protein
MDLLASVLVWWIAAVSPRQAPPASPAVGGPVGVALVRGDGRLQPLARLDGDAWSPLPATDGAGPWSLWPFDDPVVKTSPFTARAARPIGATAAATACLPTSGIDADLRPASCAAGSPPDIGVALRGSDVRPDLPTVLAIDSELGQQLATRAAAAFHRAEDETLTLEAEELPAGFPRFSARRERPITWTRIVRQGVAQGTIKTYYLEGYKDYVGFRGRTDIGQIRTTGHVFVQIAGPRETIDAEVDLSDADGHQSVFRSPLVILPWPTRAAWVFRTRGPDGVQLEIMELPAGTGRPQSVWQGADSCQGVRPCRDTEPRRSSSPPGWWPQRWATRKRRRPVRPPSPAPARWHRASSRTSARRSSRSGSRDRSIASTAATSSATTPPGSRSTAASR